MPTAPAGDQSTMRRRATALPPNRQRRQRRPPLPSLLTSSTTAPRMQLLSVLLFVPSEHPLAARSHDATPQPRMHLQVIIPDLRTASARTHHGRSER